MRRGFIVIGIVVLGVLAAMLIRRTDQVPTAHPASASVGSSKGAVLPQSSNGIRPGREAFVGSAVCAPCHEAENNAYLGSHHAKALVTPSPEMAKARFDKTHFTSKLGGTTNFEVREGAPVVITPTPGGKPEAFPIRYVSGVWPLEQYV